MGSLLSYHRFVFYLLAIYALFILCLGIPYIQRGAIYLHWARLPINADFNSPELYGIAPGQVRNFQLTTPDGAKIGVWHALPEAVYVRHFQRSETFSGSLLQSHKAPIPITVFEDALRTHKTVLYSHGNAATRAQGYRASKLRALARPSYGACEEGLNVLIYDYRGFADSSPANLFPPSEKGLIIDAKTVWDYIISSGAHPANVSIVGQSLGTGVSTGLAHRLITQENVKPNSLCLIAPFTSIPELLKTYSLFKVIPVLGPLSIMPQLQTWLLDTFLTTHFETKSLIGSITSNILLIHADDDIDIDSSHSKSLFEFLHQHHSANLTEGSDPGLPIVLPSAHKQSYLSADSQNPSSDDRLRPKFLSNEIPNYGTIHEFHRFRSHSRVIFLNARKGGHNRVGYSDTALRATVELICRSS